jgi:H/ACA ribonucleoprotein complex subunit 4
MVGIDLEKIKDRKSTKELLEFGIINIDKPSGPTSFHVSNFVTKELNLRKTSHFGTLDPKVTGILPIALNRACKLTGFFLGHDKEYVGIMSIHEDRTMEEIQKVIDEKFSGKINQLPPVKSRVKRALREREVKKFKLLEKDEKNILFLSEVQGGTYIRKLVSDLGDEMGIGAHMLELRRIRAGLFSEEDKKYPPVNLYDFEKAVEEYKKGDDKKLREMIIPAEIISEVYPSVEISEKFIFKLFSGSPFLKNYLREKKKFGEEEKICVFSGGKFIGIYEAIKSKSIFAKPLFVMQPINQ